MVLKNEDTWYSLLGYYRYQIRYNPKSIQGAVVWAAICTKEAAPGQFRERRLRLLERRPLDPELELAQQRLQRQLPGASSPVSLFSLGFRWGSCFFKQR